MEKTVVFDLPAWAALSTILDEYLKKCSHCNNVGTSECFREQLLRAQSSLHAD